MSLSIEQMLQKITDLEESLERQFAERREQIAYRIEKRKIIFEQELLDNHRRLKVGLWAYVKTARPLVMITAPFIYGLILPLLFLDLTVSMYQLVCFPVYGIQKAKRSDYIVFDRHKLAYLNILEKLNCSYCAYANGLLGYAREIASRTEEYWCPIKHAKRITDSHRRYANFPEFGDAKAYRNR